jgi:uncharacterized protein (DUF58 family)
MRNVVKFLYENWAKVVVVFTILLLLAGVVYILYKIRDKMMERVVYKRVFSDIGAYEGETVTLIETVYNPTFFPLFFVNIEGYMYNGIPLEKYEVDPTKAMQYYLSRYHLMPFMQVRRKYTVRCVKRGYYTLENVDIYYNKKKRYIESPAEVYVYPKIIPLTDPTQPTSDRQGDSYTRRWLIQDPFSLSGVREYRFGDSFNQINFKATARSGSMNIDAFKVNNRDYCSARVFMVYLNFQTDPEVPMTTSSYERMMELGLSYASAIVRDAAYNGYRCGFAANCATVTGDDNIRFPIAAGVNHLEEILKEMAKVRHNVGISFASMLEYDIANGMADNEVFIITPAVNEELDDKISQLRRFNNFVNVFRLEDEDRRRIEEEEREMELNRIEQERLEKEKSKLTKEQIALQKILEQQKEIEEQNERARAEYEAAQREREKEERLARQRERTAHLRARQQAMEELNRQNNDSQGGN